MPTRIPARASIPTKVSILKRSIRGRGSPAWRRAPAWPWRRTAGRAVGPGLRNGPPLPQTAPGIARRRSDSVFKDPCFPSPLASLDGSSRGQIFLRRRRACRPRQRGEKGRLADICGPPAGVGEPPAGISDPPAGVGDPPAGVSDPLAGTGDPLAGTGEPIADSGEPLAGAGRTMKDAGRRIADVNRSMGSAGQRIGDTGRSMGGTGRSMGDAGRSITDAGETSFNRETWTLEAGAP